jgi:hypothetical protein
MGLDARETLNDILSASIFRNHSGNTQRLIVRAKKIRTVGGPENEEVLLGNYLKNLYCSSA